MANRLFQNVIDQMSKSTKRLIGIIEYTGTIVSCSDQTKIGIFNDSIEPEMFNKTEPFVISDCTYMPFSCLIAPDCMVFVEGTDDSSKEIARLLSISFSSIKQYYDEKYDKVTFLKKVLLENILPGDLEQKTRELRLDTNVIRVCLYIKILTKTEIAVYDVIQKLFPDTTKDYVININSDDIVLVKEIKEDTSINDLENLGKSVVDNLLGDFYIHSIVGIGTRVKNVRDIVRSYNAAKNAINVSDVFDRDRNVVSYENLGLARLIYQLPDSLCEMFMREVFKNGSIESLDQETLFTIQKFFENNLNVSETSRKLFVHRNTLVYRLDKILKLTGLDLREFEDAIVFKVALMVKKYLNSKSRTI